MHILFDIGGTHMRVVGTNDCREFASNPIILNTPELYDEGVALLCNTAKQLSAGQKIETVTGGIAGPLNPDHDGLVGAPNLPDWVSKPLKQDISERLDSPVRIENDAVVNGLGEATHGAGRGSRIVAYITLSTGVGGARIVDGKPDLAHFGFEAGHQIIGEVGGEPKWLTDCISGKALKEKYGSQASGIEDEKSWDEIVHNLSLGLNNIIVLWSPDCIVLGGPISQSVPLDKLKERLNKLVDIFPEIPEIKLAEIEDVGGLYGALELIRVAEEG